MKILVRTFNPHINSKTGAMLPPGQTRGTPEWLEFESLMFQALNRIDNGLKVTAQMESPIIPDIQDSFDKRFYVHQTKREKPCGDLFWMQMHMCNLFTLDTNGWGADHSRIISKDFEFSLLDEHEATRFCQELSDKLWSSGLSKCEQPTETDVTPERFILVPIQTPRDYVLKHHSPITMRYFIDSIQAWAIEAQQHIVFKMHPHNKGDLDLHQAVDQACDSRYIHKAEGNIHELIKRCDGVFVINSGTGFESLIHGKPVCTFGNCDYKFVTHNGDMRRLDAARTFIYSYKEDYRKLAYKFVLWYHTLHAYDVSDPGVPERLYRYLKGVLA